MKLKPECLGDTQGWFQLGLLASVCLFLGIIAAAPVSAQGSEPISLHPENPHYFIFRGLPAVLITSGEHYGAVLNLDFDYLSYLDELKAHRFNLTRTFSGTYREVPGSFGITSNTLAPAPGRYVCPWARSIAPGASDGGHKFDLRTWDSAYFERLKHFVREAGRRGIVVELVLFCVMYDDSVWNASPMNATNNLNGIGKVGRNQVYTLQEHDLLQVQLALVRKIAAELKGFDNVYYELCNEPYERGGLTREWNDRIIAAIVETEAAFPARHLIAQGIAHGSAKIAEPHPGVSIFNFHAATPDAVRSNYHLGKSIADDETGGKGIRESAYRIEAWEFILAGGAVVNHLDFSFAAGHERGNFELPPTTPGGGGPTLRRQLRVLKDFIDSFDFIRLEPTDSVIRELPPGTTAHALMTRGKAYAIYLKGGTQTKLVLDIPTGPYKGEWINPQTGEVAKVEQFEHPGGNRTLHSPAYMEDIALRLKSWR